jgi:MerR family transcriptional regulator, copper efflux regulator
LAAVTDGLTIHEAAETTGWSSRMLRYLERVGLIDIPRTESGYRIFGPGELQRLRTLRELLARFDCGLSDVAFAKRMRDDERLRDEVERWLEAQPRRPENVPSSDWLRFEQEKHERLLSLPEVAA